MRADIRLLIAGVLAVLASVWIPAVALANGATVLTYGTCVTYGIDPSAHVAAPMTVVTNAKGEKFLIPHQSVDGQAPPAFSGGWSACGR